MTPVGESAAGPRSVLRAALVTGAWLALALLLVRATMLFGMDRLAHGHDLAQTQRRLATALPTIAAGAGAIALGLTAALAALVRDPRSTGRRVAALLVAAAGAWLALRFLAGWWSDDASRAVGLDTSRGRSVATALGALAGALALGTWILLGRAARARPPDLRLALPPLVLLLVLPAGWRLAFASLGERMAVRTTVVDLLAGDAAWTVVEAREDAPPRVGSVCPSTLYSAEGADMPTLVLPPPAEVVVRAPEGLGPVVLSARAGIDHRLVADPGLRGSRVRFTVEVAGEERERIEVAVAPQGGVPGTEWVTVGGDDGLWVGAGEEVRLATRWLDPAGSEATPPGPLLVGFGGLSFERRWSRPRTLATPVEPNVVLIVMDTLRADRTSVYGYAQETTPHLAALAARGVVYERAYASASWTWPSTASILTGKLPQEHGVEDQSTAYLSGVHQTLGEALQDAGLTTAAFSANVLIVPDKNFDQGFELFDHGEGGTRPSEVVMPRALEWVEATAPTRFFLYLHLADPHAPLDPLPEARARFAADVPQELPTRRINEHQRRLLEGCAHGPDGRVELERCVPAEEREWIRRLYDACVWSGDHQVGRLLALLDELGLTDRTIVAFTSDHGEELYDHGFATHGHALYEELVRVPLVLAGPGLPAGVRVPTPVSNRHLAPTLARLAGAEFRGAADPLDLARPEAVRAAGGEEILTSTAKGWWNGRATTPLFSLRQGDLSLHFAPEGGAWGAEEGTGDWRLFDLARDPAQTVDLADERTADAERLRQRLLEHLGELAERRPDSPILEAGEATLERLRAIGYLGED